MNRPQMSKTVFGRSYKLRRMPIAVCVSVLLGAVFAVSDEFHQFFSEGRGPSVQDVLLDTCGAAAGSCFIHFSNDICSER